MSSRSLLSKSRNFKKASLNTGLNTFESSEKIVGMNYSEENEIKRMRLMKLIKGTRMNLSYKGS